MEVLWGSGKSDTEKSVRGAARTGEGWSEGGPGVVQCRVGVQGVTSSGAAQLGHLPPRHSPCPRPWHLYRPAVLFVQQTAYLRTSSLELAALEIWMSAYIWAWFPMP